MTNEICAGLHYNFAFKLIVRQDMIVYHRLKPKMNISNPSRNGGVFY